MILITGAGGKTGKALTRALSKVESICALIHNEGQVSAMKSLGAERVIVGEMLNESTIRSAMRDVRAVYHICPNMHPDETAIGRLIIDASREHKIEHLVFHSVLHPQTEKMNHHWQKLQVEEMIFESGLPFTIMQPAPYMQNLLTSRKSIIEDREVRVPYSVHSKFSFVDLEDIAAAAKIVLTEPDHKNAAYELAGTSSTSHVQVAEILTSVLGYEIHAKKEETSYWKLRAEQGGMSEYAISNLVRMFEYYDKWGLVGNPNVLGWILKRQPATLESFFIRTFLNRPGMLEQKDP